MNAKSLIGLLATTIPAKLPVLIKGRPGVGKSDIVEQATASAKADFVLMHPAVLSPIDFTGLPANVNGLAQFLPFGSLRRLVEAKKLTVCFLDDLGQAAAVVQAAAMQLILARCVGDHKVSPHVVFLAATNRREDKAGVTGILEPVKSRFATIVELEPSVDDWAQWALDHNVPPVLVAFVRFRPELMLAKFVPTQDIINQPCPRTVTHLGKLYAAGVRDAEALAGAAGTAFATEFTGFVKVWEELPSVEGIVLNPASATVPKNPAALYAITTAVANRIDAKVAGKVLKYLTRLPEEFSVLGVRDAHRRCPEMVNCREFVEWAAAHPEVVG